MDGHQADLCPGYRLAINLATDASAQCSTVNPTCDFAFRLKYCPDPIACNVDTDCGVGRGRCITGFCRGGRPTGGCHPACQANQRCACPPWDTQCPNLAFGQCADLPRPGGGTGGAGGGGSGTGSPPACGGHGPVKLSGVCNSDCRDNQRCQGYVCKSCGPRRPPSGPSCTATGSADPDLLASEGRCTAV